MLASLWTGVQRAVQAADDPALAPRSGTLSTEAGRNLETLTDLAVHNAYHWGQVVLMRRVLGDWPPATS
ncbi:hypothetical protein [Deinococcus sp.]|uniref:hypothetical protein n=1 Tax=Deinococcus sp. TaxID=47478 RepID=UPI0025F92C6E|nr:hypothetical protein [Deinococcus sp.]